MLPFSSNSIPLVDNSILLDPLIGVMIVNAPLLAGVAKAQALVLSGVVIQRSLRSCSTT